MAIKVEMREYRGTKTDTKTFLRLPQFEFQKKKVPQNEKRQMIPVSFDACHFSRKTSIITRPTCYHIVTESGQLTEEVNLLIFLRFFSHRRC